MNRIGMIARIIVTAWMLGVMMAEVVPTAAALSAVVVDAPAMRLRRKSDSGKRLLLSR
jgi:hypothetical protein